MELGLRQNVVAPQQTCIPISSLSRSEEETYSSYQSEELHTNITINKTDISSLEENDTQGQVVNDEVDKKTSRDKVVRALALSIFGTSGSYLLQLMGYSFILIALVIVVLILSFGIIVHPKIRDSVVAAVLAFLTLVSKLISSIKSHTSSLGNMCRSQQQVSFDRSNPGNQGNQPVPVSKRNQVSLGMELRKNHFIVDAPTRVTAFDPWSNPSTSIDRDSSESSESNNINDADIYGPRVDEEDHSLTFDSGLV